MNEFLKNVIEVRKAYSEEQVNKLLSKGWKLIHVGTYSNPPYEYGTEFILARVE